MATRKATLTPASAPAPAPAPTPAKTTAVAARKSTNVVSIQENLKQMAATLAERTMPAGGNKIRITQDKKFILPDGATTEGPLQLIIVDFVTVHQFYGQKYDRNNIVPPECFAVGLNPKQMFPLKESPNLQADDCQSCQMNAFGSGNGEGKACKNSRRLAVLPEGATADDPMWILDVSPTGLRAFDGFVGQIVRTFGLPPVSVVATVSFDESVDYSRLVFSDPKPNEALDVCYARMDEAREMLMQAPDFTARSAPAARKAAPARKAPARR